MAALAHSLTRKTVLIFVGFAILAFVGIELGFRGLRRYADSIETAYKRIQEDGDNVCTLDLSGLPAAASAEVTIRMDDLDAQLCKIRDNLSEATKDMHEFEGAVLKTSAGGAQPDG